MRVCAKNVGGAYARGGAYLRDTTVINIRKFPLPIINALIAGQICEGLLGVSDSLVHPLQASHVSVQWADIEARSVLSLVVCSSLDGIC